jgi:hypothetical protein
LSAEFGGQFSLTVLRCYKTLTPFPLILSICLLAAFSLAIFTTSVPRFEDRSTLTMAGNNLLCQIRWIDRGVLVKELLVVIARQPVLVVGWAQYAPLEIVARTALCKPAFARTIELAVAGSVGPNTTALLPS